MRVFLISVIIWLISVPSSFSQPAEPGTLRMVKQFGTEQEQRLNELERLDLKSVLEELTSPAFFSEEEYLDEAIYRSFNYRVSDAVAFMMRFVHSTQTAGEGGRSLYIAKRVFQVFPNDSLGPLLDLYSMSGPRVRANVIYAIGQMSGDPAVRSLLTEALYDESICQEMTAETVGEPLRICDVAYNQLVIRYKFDNMLRTIGTAHALDVRDYHIDLLRAKL